MQIWEWGEATFQTWETANSKALRWQRYLSEDPPGSQCGYSGVRGGAADEVTEIRGGGGMARSYRGL